MRHFYEVTLIVEGAMDETKLLDSETQIDDYVAGLRQEHNRISAESVWEVYVLKHEHSPMVECECGQYLADHHPTYTIP